ncbi:hypothetical protein DFS34DRAFT_628274 [Phlyctochytrium arcticum]|nr:hypothetical protein DFS34DRAFT_628274 [Phlyctochytrium arcticum]
MTDRTRIMNAGKTTRLASGSAAPPPPSATTHASASSSTTISDATGSMHSHDPDDGTAAASPISSTSTISHRPSLSHHHQPSSSSTSSPTTLLHHHSHHRPSSSSPTMIRDNSYGSSSSGGHVWTGSHSTVPTASPSGVTATTSGGTSVGRTTSTSRHHHPPSSPGGAGFFATRVHSFPSPQTTSSSPQPLHSHPSSSTSSSAIVADNQDDFPFTVYTYHLEEEILRSSTIIYESGWRELEDGSDSEKTRYPIIAKTPIQRTALEANKLERDNHLTAFISAAWKEDHAVHPPAATGEESKIPPPNRPFLEPIYMSSSGDRGLCLYFKHTESDIIPLNSILQADAVSHDLPLREKIDIVIQLCDALDFLHRFRITHRFLTVDSVLYSPTSHHIYVTEFEYASADSQTIYESHADSPIDHLDDDNLDVEQLVSLSPEIVAKSLDRSVDHRSDLYQLGIIMYRMFAGDFPFKGPPMKILHAIQVTKAPHFTCSDDHPCSTALAKIIHKLLMKMPEDRYQTAYGIKKDVEQCLRQIIAIELLPQESAFQVETINTKIAEIDFKLGEHDISPVPRMPKVLFGREQSLQRAVSLVDAAIERVIGKTSTPATEYRDAAAKAVLAKMIGNPAITVSDEAATPPPPRPSTHAGGCEFLLVSGRAGMGKTAFVEELISCSRSRLFVTSTSPTSHITTVSSTVTADSPTTAANQGTSCLFARGKFDFMSDRGSPYSGLVACLRTLIFQVMSQPDVDDDRKRIISKIHPHEKLLINLFPEAAILLGLDTPLQDLEEVDAQQSKLRFQHVIINTFMALASKRPLILFLDDLQWACTGTMEVLNSLALTTGSGPGSHILVVLAYRQDPDHPNWEGLSRLIHQLKKRRTTGVTTIELEGLPLKAIHDMLSYIIDYRVLTPTGERGGVPGLDDDGLWELSRVLSRKTRANPSFLLQTISSMFKADALFYDWKKHMWSWNVETIEGMDLTDNVVNFLITQLDNLPIEAKNCLILGACCGTTFSVDLVEHCVAQVLLAGGKPSSPIDEESGEQRLDEAKEYASKGLQIAAAEGLIKPGIAANEYVFSHGHIHQAADALAGRDLKTSIYLCIGRCLMDQSRLLQSHLNLPPTTDTPLTPHSPQRINVFAIADHMNPYMDDIHSPNERLRLRHINKIAVNNAKESGDLESAVRYAEGGIKLLPENAWADPELHEEAVFFHYVRGECGLATARTASEESFNAAMEYIQEIIDNTTSNFWRAMAFNIKVRILSSLDRAVDAVNCGIDGLVALGIETKYPITDEERDSLIAECTGLLSGIDVDDILTMKRSDDRTIGATVDLILILASLAYFVDRNFHAFLLAKAVLITFENGISPMSVWGLGSFVGIYMGEEQPVKAYRIGTALAALSRSYKMNAVTTRIFIPHALTILHLQEHFRGAIPFYKEGYTAASMAGLTWFQGLALSMWSVTELLMGENLQNVVRQAHQRLRLVEAGRWWEDGSVMLIGLYRYCMALRDHTGTGEQIFDDPLGSTDARFSEAEYLASHAGGAFRSLGWNWFKGMALLTLGHPVLALVLFEESNVQLNSIPGGFMYYPIIHFYHALTLLAVARMYRNKAIIPNEEARMPAMLRSDDWCLKRFDCIAARVEKYADIAVVNYRHLDLILKAERAGLDGDLRTALSNFEAAVEHSVHHGFIQYEALANELQAELLLAQGLKTTALPVLRIAAEKYRAWGADKKAQMILARVKIFSLPAGGSSRSGIAATSLRAADSGNLTPGSSYIFSRTRNFVFPGEAGRTLPSLGAGPVNYGLTSSSIHSISHAGAAGFDERVGNTLRANSSSTNSSNSNIVSGRRFTTTSMSSRTSSNSPSVGGVGDGFEGNSSVDDAVSNYSANNKGHGMSLLSGSGGGLGSASALTSAGSLPAQSFNNIGPNALNNFDLSSVISAIQILTSEIQFQRLIPKMMNLIAENSAASKGALILEDAAHRDLVVESIFDATGGEGDTVNANNGGGATTSASTGGPRRSGSIAPGTADFAARAGFRSPPSASTPSPKQQSYTTIKRMPLAEADNVFSQRIIRYVARSRLPLILSDATHDLLTADDPYIVASGAKSILCLPMLRRDKVGLVGVLYLENAAVAGAFSAKNVQVLSLLCSQIAISVEHAILFRNVQAARRAAEDGNKRNRYILESLPQLIWTTDKNGNVTFMNRRWTEYTGRSVQTLMGFGWADLLHPDDVAATLEAWKQSLDTLCAYAVEYRLRAADGSCRWFVGRGTVLKLVGEDGTEEVDMWLGTTTDIQDQKEATEWKRIERELRETREAALNTARLKSSWCANLSHELRTPFNGVLGMINLLTETTLSEEQIEYVYTAKQSCENLLFVIDGILDFSKLEAGMVRHDSVPADLESLVEQTCDLLITLASDKGIELYSFASTPIPLVEADPHLIRQTLLNLVGNSIKFTHQGEVHIEISVEDNPAGPNAPSEPDMVHIRFEVRDTGIGLSESELSLLFKPFSQVDGSTTRIYGGTGLGLSICKAIVEVLGGSIGVKSAKGRGSTFWFTAKLRKIQDVAMASGNRAIGNNTGTVLDGSATPRTTSGRSPAAIAAAGASATGHPTVIKLLPWDVGGPPFETSARILLVADNPWKATSLSHFRRVLPNPLVTMDHTAFLRDVTESTAIEDVSYGLIIIDLDEHEALVKALEALDRMSIRIAQSAKRTRLTNRREPVLVLITPKLAKALTNWQPTADFGIHPVKLTKPLSRRKIVRALGDVNTVLAQSNGSDLRPRVGADNSTVPRGTSAGVTGSSGIDTVSMQLDSHTLIQERKATASLLKVSPTIMIAEDNPIAAKVTIKTIEKLNVPKNQIIWVKDGQEAIEYRQKLLDQTRLGIPVKLDMILMDLHMPRKDGFAASRAIRKLEQEYGVEHGVPIVGLTADVQSSARASCLENGMNDYLVKPCPKAELANAINRWAVGPSSGHTSPIVPSGSLINDSSQTGAAVPESSTPAAPLVSSPTSTKPSTALPRPSAPSSPGDSSNAFSPTPINAPITTTTESPSLPTAK